MPRSQVRPPGRTPLPPAAHTPRHEFSEPIAVIHSRKAEKVSSDRAEESQPRRAPGRRRRILVWLLVLCVVLPALGVVAFLGWQKGWWGQLLHFANRRTVLVLPFEVQGQEEGAELLGRAFAESLGMNLAVS